MLYTIHEWASEMWTTEKQNTDCILKRFVPKTPELDHPLNPPDIIIFERPWKTMWRGLRTCLLEMRFQTVFTNEKLAWGQTISNPNFIELRPRCGDCNKIWEQPYCLLLTSVNFLISIIWLIRYTVQQNIRSKTRRWFF